MNTCGNCETLFTEIDEQHFIKDAMRHGISANQAQAYLDDDLCKLLCKACNAVKQQNDEKHAWLDEEPLPI
jgi:hypothetical protein